MIRKIVLAALAAAALPTAASAVTYDFAGDFGNSVFQYGLGTNGSSFTAFTNTYSGGCGGAANFACQTAGGSGLGVADLPGIGAAPGGATFSTVSLPSGTLFLHPGAGAGQDAILRFVAPTAADYRISATVSRLDTTSNGDGVIGTLFVNGTPIDVPTALTPGSGPYTRTGTINLAAGDILSFGVNQAGDLFYDSTGLTGTITSVPEPASWAMMIGGFGFVGGSLRARRRKVSFA